MKFPERLLNVLVNAKRNNLTGKSLVISSQNIQWQLYFLFGKLIWLNGGSHPHRSWLRYLVQFCPEFNCEELFSETQHHYECSQYKTLYLLSKKQLISKECLKSILENKIQEHFVDILQEAQTYDVNYIIKPDSPRNLLNCGFKPDLVIIDSQELFQNSQKYSSLFDKYAFNNISLNAAPKVLDPNRLQAKVDLDTYSKLIHLLNGQLTWRDLSLKFNKDLIQVARFLVPYFNQGILELREVPDLASNFTQGKSVSNAIDKRIVEQSSCSHYSSLHVSFFDAATA